MTSDVRFPCPVVDLTFLDDIMIYLGVLELLFLSLFFHILQFRSNLKINPGDKYKCSFLYIWELEQNLFITYISHVGTYFIPYIVCVK